MLGDFEQLILLALARLGDDAYGIAVQDEITRRAKRDVSLGAVYKTLSRLEDKGLVSTWVGEPTAQRGGRRKRHYRMLPAGRAELRQSLAGIRAMTRGLEPGFDLP